MGGRLASRIAAAALVALASLALAPAEAQVGGVLDFTPDERARILAHGPWPLPSTPDPTNRLSGRPQAIEIGEILFFEKRLSADGKVSCATCHQPERAWIDGDRRARGRDRVDRNTPTLANVRLHQSFGWAGGADSLWAQAVRPVLDPREMAADATHVAKVLRADADLACRLEKAAGVKLGAIDDESVLVTVGKSLAAFMETLASGRAPFDHFREALARGDDRAAAGYSLAAQRGLRLFVGKAQCAACHSGPNFTNQEFRRTGVPLAIDKERVDAGRFDGLRQLVQSRFNLASRYNDDPSQAGAAAVKQATVSDRDWGRFRVPSLRNAALTQPYMHNGHFGTLREVVDYYADFRAVRTYPNADPLLKPLGLTAQERNDLLVFLESLTNFQGQNWRPSSYAPCE
jgi:cytochrome c peroxidase